MRSRGAVAAILTSIVLGLGVVLASSASAQVLINAPAPKVCVHHTFRIGVWYQSFSGGSRGYRVAVYGPSGRRIFYRHGQAPSEHWQFWHIDTGISGRFTTVYRSGPEAKPQWRKTFHTDAHPCRRP